MAASLNDKQEKDQPFDFGQLSKTETKGAGSATATIALTTYIGTTQTELTLRA